MGVPFACFATTDGSEWNSDCANGQHHQDRRSSGATWSATPTPATPARGRGCRSGTAPTTTRCATRTSAKQIKQWTNVHGLSQTPDASPTPRSPAGPAPATAAPATRRRSRRSACRASAHNLPLSAGRRWRSASSAWTPPTTAAHHRRPPSSAPPPRRRTSAPPPAGGCRVTYAVNAWNTGLTAARHHHQHRHRRGQRLVAGLHPAQRTDHHLRAGTPPTPRPAARSPRATHLQRRPSPRPRPSSIGFQATHTGNTGKPTSFTLNGHACTVA